MKEGLIIAIILVVAFGYPHVKSYIANKNAVENRVYSDEYFIVEEPALVEMSPRILEAVLLRENSEEMVFNVTYILPTNAPKGDYALSVHPNMGHWSYSQTNLVRGKKDTVQVKVNFRPQDEDVTEASSTLMKFYLSHHKDNQWAGYAYQKDVPYDKIWRRL